MDEKELYEIIIKIVAILLVVIVFGTLLTLVFVNKFGAKEISVNKIIDKKETLYVLVINNDTNNRKDIENVLKEKELDYTLINKDKEFQYDSFLKKISITKEDIIEPSIIYIKDKKVNSILVDIRKIDDLEEFLEYNMNS